MKNLNYLLISFLFLFNYSSAQTTVTLQPGPVDGNDAFVWDYNPNTNYGSSDALDVTGWTADGTNYISRILLQFDLTSLPPNIMITNAQLSLYYNNTTSNYSSIHSGANASYLQRITSNWQSNSVTWNNQPTVTSANQIALAQTTSGTQNFTNIDITTMVGDMVYNPSTNFGFMLRLQNESPYRDLIFASSNHANSTLRPKLVLTYIPCTAPVAQITPSTPLSFCAGTSVYFYATSIAGASYQWQKYGVNVSGATSSIFTTQATGNYRCIVTSACGASATSNTVHITKLQLAVLTISAAGPTTFCAGGNVILNTSNPGAGYTLQWYRNNISIPGATGVSYLVSSPGTYKVLIYNVSTGCSRLSNGIVIKVNSCRNENPLLIVDASLTENKLLVYPNPASNYFSFELQDNSELNGEAEIVLYNSLGLKVYVSEVQIINGQPDHLIVIQNKLRAGIYFLQVTIENNCYLSRVIFN